MMVSFDNAEDDSGMLVLGWWQLSLTCGIVMMLNDYNADDLGSLVLIWEVSWCLDDGNCNEEVVETVIRPNQAEVLQRN